MSKIKLKICGMRDPQNILEVAALSPEYMGFIFFDKSPRNVGMDLVLPENFSSGITKVGVFVNALTDFILQQVHRLELDVVQLHGKESVDQLLALKDAGVKIIKVFSVDDDFDFNNTRPYKAVADFFLFDTKGKYYGGNAKVFDWRVLEAYDQEVPFFLSGGVGPDNIKDVAAIRNMNIHALDVNSGVEKEPAIKDIEKIKELQRNIKSYL